MKVIKVKSEVEKVKKVRELIESVGNKIGNVHFIKRSDGSKRKMSYRLHVRKPSYASIPTGKSNKKNRSKDLENKQITVFDTNKMRYSKKGVMNGRGDWRSIPLENVTRVSVNGVIYKIMG